LSINITSNSVDWHSSRVCCDATT